MKRILLTGRVSAGAYATACLVLSLHTARAADQGATLATQRVSINSNGLQGEGESDYAALSGDGRYVVFSSFAPNLVSGDQNEAGDVFVKDLMSGAIVCASVAANGTPAFGESFAPSISTDGRLVAFTSEATELVVGDTNKMRDVFLRDLVAHTTVRVSLSQAGTEADGDSTAPRISSDGHFIVFASRASNLVPGDANEQSDIFLRSLEAGTLERISVAASGQPADGSSEGATVSADGRYVAFASTALNLLAGGDSPDAPRTWDVYRRDRISGSTSRVSVSLSGAKGDGHSFCPAMSNDGRYIAFASYARNLVSSDLNEVADIFIRDMTTGTMVRASIGIGGLEATGESARPSLSGDGRYLVFASVAANLVPDVAPAGLTWVYVRDLVEGVTCRVIAAPGEARPDGGMNNPSFSADGGWIVFASGETELVPGDSNGLRDVFVRGPLH